MPNPPPVGEAEALIRKAAKNPEKARRVVVAVATRHLGWELVEVAGKMPGVKYGALAQAVRRFWRLAGERTELAEFVGRMPNKCK